MANINASIVDQKVMGIVERHSDLLPRGADENKQQLYKKSLEELDQAIQDLYGGRKDISLQQLSATFRRGDLLAH